MEIVLQWLDDLDDFVFTAFAVWPRIRRLCLAIALIAAAGLHVLPLLGLAIGADVMLLEVSLAALAVWAIVGAVAARADRSGRLAAVNG